MWLDNTYLIIICTYMYIPPKRFGNSKSVTKVLQIFKFYQQAKKTFIFCFKYVS